MKPSNVMLLFGLARLWSCQLKGDLAHLEYLIEYHGEANLSQRLVSRWLWNWYRWLAAFSLACAIAGIEWEVGA